MRHRFTIATLGLCGLTLLSPAAARSQATLDPATRILIAAAQKARTTVTTPGRFMIEVSGLPAESNQAITVAKLAKAELGTSKDVLRCETSATACRLKRTDAFVLLTLPNVAGDTVSVPATVWQQPEGGSEPAQRQELEIQVVRHGLAWVAHDVRVRQRS
jgi:hypothetical protein